MAPGQPLSSMAPLQPTVAVANVSEARARLKLGAAVLDRTETSWQARQEFLASRGYMLRPRYHPGWVPSWVKNPRLDYEDCEDHVPHPLRPNLIDATRQSSNTLVYIKRVPSESEELRIALLLGTEPLCLDPRNHATPILDHFEDDEDRKITYMVMPFLRPIDKPPFEIVGQVVDFVDQILVGLVFLHEHGVAHRDCAFKNILMCADGLFPRGFHPIYLSELPDLSGYAPVLPRHKAPVKYYYIDFGISSLVARDEGDGQVVGELGRDQDVPELSATVPYDPFKVDVFIIGHLLRAQFYAKYNNVAFLRPLILAMMERDPKDRPTAREALDSWRKLRSALSATRKAWRVRPREEGFLSRWRKELLAGITVWPHIVSLPPTAAGVKPESVAKRTRWRPREVIRREL